LVDELDLAHLEGEKHYYETRLKQEHAHIICLRCGRVEEFFGEPLQTVRGQVASQFDFEIVFARTEIGGLFVHCPVMWDPERRGPSLKWRPWALAIRSKCAPGRRQPDS